MIDSVAVETKQGRCGTSEASVEACGPGRFVLKCPPEMAWHARVELVGTLTGAIGGQMPIELILDLSGVEFLNSAGIGAIFSVRKHVIGGGGKVVMCNVRPIIRRLLNTVNLPALMPVLPDLGGAHAQLDQRGQSE